MRLHRIITIAAALSCAPGAWAQFTRAAPQAWSDNTGFVSLFNGKDLTGWHGRPGVWSVRDDAITATAAPAHPVGISNIWYTGAEPANFILKVEVRMLGPSADGGIQYRSHPGSPESMPAARRGVRRHVTAILVDNDPAHFAARGVIGFEIGGQDATIQYRNIELKTLP